MKTWIKIPHNRIFLSILLLLISLNVLATISENPLLLMFTKPVFIPALLIYYFLRNKYIKLVFVVFLILFFFGDLSSVIFAQHDIIKVSSVAYCLSYLCLASFVVSRFKRIKFDTFIGVYLVTVFIINAYFLYVLFTILKAIIPDQTEVILFAVKSISLLVLTFVAFALYLNSDTKQSITLLVTSLCFVFSDVLYYISYYYIYDWSFVMLDRVLHVIGLFFLFSYMIETNRKRKKQAVIERMSSENILAKQL